PADPAQTFVATYDAWNRLVKLTDGTDTVAEYVYDGMNRRTVKRTYTAGTLSETRHYYYSQGWQILEERVGSGSPSSLNPDRQYLWGLQYVDQRYCRAAPLVPLNVN
ncbi:RHS repeat protein, partial [bacterium]|nr:RHS repeat protein [bacterium]